MFIKWAVFVFSLLMSCLWCAIFHAFVSHLVTASRLLPVLFHWWCCVIIHITSCKTSTNQQSLSCKYSWLHTHTQQTYTCVHAYIHWTQALHFILLVAYKINIHIHAHTKFTLSFLYPGIAVRYNTVNTLPPEGEQMVHCYYVYLYICSRGGHVLHIYTWTRVCACLPWK